VPRQFVQAFGKEENFRRTLEKQTTDWMLNVIDDVSKVSLDCLKSIPLDKFDDQRGHRLYAFPILVATQFLPHADEKTRDALSWRIGQILSDTQNDRGNYTESARDQLNQIIPQVLTDQLLVGPIAWNNLVITRDVLDPLIDLGKNPDKTSRFETGLALSLQFIIYYRSSLESKIKRRRFPIISQEQKAIIDDFMTAIKRGNFSLDPSVIKWVDALQEHSAHAATLKFLFRKLVRQSSAAVMARNSGAQFVPKKIWHLCIINNLRAAHRSLGLPDCDDRRDRVTRFLTANGVTRKDGLEVVKAHITKQRPEFYEDMQEFVKKLPEEIDVPKNLKPNLFSMARELTVDDLWAELSPYRTWQKWENVAMVAANLAKPLEGLVSRIVWPLVRRGLRRLKLKRNRDKERNKKLHSLIKGIIEEDNVFRKMQY
jgi:hypothetical protein